MSKHMTFGVTDTAEWRLNHRRRLETAKPNSIAVKRPDLLEVWDWKKNCETGLDPYVLGSKSNKKAWWRCPDYGHSYETVIQSKTLGYGCPYCKNKKVLPGFNDVATTHKHLLGEWDHEHNTVRPDQITYGSQIKIAWVCADCGNRYNMTVSDRLRGRRCPACAKKDHVNPKTIVAPGNSLKDVFPEIAAEWHPYKNGDSVPEDYRPHSNKKVWWMCSFGHEWESTINNRTGTYRRGCPHCSARLRTSFPEKAIFYYVSKLFDDAISCATVELGDETVSFDVWIESIHTAIEYDGGHWHTDKKREDRKNRLCLDNGIKMIRVSEPGCVKYNDIISVVRIERGDDRSFKTLDDAISSVFDALGRSGSVSVDSDRDECEIRSLINSSIVENSFGKNCPDAASEWHPTKNGSITPYTVSHHSGFKAWFVCENNHEYRMSVANRAKGCGCLTCAMKKCGMEKMMPDAGKSLADMFPESLAAWHPTNNGDMTPWDVTPCSNKKFWWSCVECGDDYVAAPMKKTRYGGGFLCASCARKAAGMRRRERVGLEFLKTANLNNEDVEVIGQYVRSKTKISCRCKVCGYVWDAWPDNIKKGHGCPECAKDKRTATRRRRTQEVDGAAA